MLVNKDGQMNHTKKRHFNYVRNKNKTEKIKQKFVKYTVPE